MDSRLRAGLIAGSGAAITTLLLSITGFWFCGPVLAVICGLSTGMQVARDPNIRQQPVAAAALAGTYAGLLLLVAQIAGMVIFLNTPQAATVFQQLAVMDPAYTNSFVRIVLLIFGIFISLVDLGIIIGAAAGMVAYLTRGQDRSVVYQNAQRQTQVYSPTVPAYQPPPVPEKKLPTPPATYPPPPEFYGQPSILVTTETDEHTHSSEQSDIAPTGQPEV